jgi:hypothetical protein
MKAVLPVSIVMEDFLSPMSVNAGSSYGIAGWISGRENLILA